MTITAPYVIVELKHKVVKGDESMNMHQARAVVKVREIVTVNVKKFVEMTTYSSTWSVILYKLGRLTIRHLNFYRLHFAYFVMLSFVGTILLWVSRRSQSVTLVDCIFSSVSACTVTGVLTVSLRDISTFGTVVLMFLMLMGSHVFTSLLPVYVRRFYFFRHINLTASASDLSHKIRHRPALHRDNYRFNITDTGVDDDPDSEPTSTESDVNLSTSVLEDPSQNMHLPPLCQDGFVATPAPDKLSVVESCRFVDGSTKRSTKFPCDDVHPPHDWQTACREDNTGPVQGLPGFLTMSDERRVGRRLSSTKENLLRAYSTEGHCIKICTGKEVEENNLAQSVRLERSLEHQALITLCWLVPTYFVVLQVFGFFAILCYCLLNFPPVIKGIFKEERVHPTFFAVFSSVSAFSNTGISLIDENFLPFRSSPQILLPLAVLILTGNTMFAPCMRFIIWSLYKCMPITHPQRQVYEYMLKYPRRCYTHLFPQVHTVWLVVTVMAFNIIESVALCALAWNSPGALAGLSFSTKLMDGFFQSLNTRSAGMNVIVLNNLAPAMLVLYVGMMYLAVYPVFLSRQNSRPIPDSHSSYNESDICIFRNLHDAQMEDNKISVQYKKLISQDAIYVFFSILLICILESQKVISDPLNYSIFNIIFEIISAYGNVGLSMGYSCEQRIGGADKPCEDVPYSLSGKWSVTSKLIVIAVMLLGRHRGLPDNIDSAISLPHYP